MATHNAHQSVLHAIALDDAPPGVKRLGAITREVVAPMEPPPVETLTPEQHDGVLDELWHRRNRVQSMRLRGKTQAEIAAALKVNQATVSRDIAWMRAHRKEQLAQFDPDQELVEALGLFDEVERSALRDYSMATEGKDRNAFLRTAVLTRMARLNVLQDQGVLKRNLGTAAVLHVRASDVRGALERNGLLVQGGSASKMLAETADEPLDRFMEAVG